MRLVDWMIRRVTALVEWVQLRLDYEAGNAFRCKVCRRLSYYGCRTADDGMVCVPCSQDRK